MNFIYAPLNNLLISGFSEKMKLTPHAHNAMHRMQKCEKCLVRDKNHEINEEIKKKTFIVIGF